MTYSPVADLEQLCYLPPETILWRYIDLAKFIDLVARGTLYFPQLAELQSDDPHEGKLSTTSARRIATERAGKHPGKIFLPGKIAETYNDAADNLYINCWHATRESVAMWRLYAREGVAIKSSVTKIRAALEDVPFDVVGGKVSYSTRLPHLRRTEFRTAFRKRTAYRYESEARLAIFDESGGEPFRRVIVDPLRFVSQIIISPFAAPYVASSIEEVRRQWAPKIPIRSSTLLAPLMYSSRPISG